MIESIEIQITKECYNLYKALIIPSKNICYFGNKKHQINNQNINSILDIISTWNYEYGNSNILRCRRIYNNGLFK